jgi:ribonuclease HI
MIAYAQLPTMTVRLVCVYGVQHCSPNAAAKNRSLWMLLLELLATSNIPTLVGGDFNLRPQSTDVWSELQSLGFAEVFEHHQSAYGEMLPPTCDQSTRNDTLLFSKHFANLFRKAYVDQNHLFPRHDPLLVSFELPTCSFVHRALAMPEPLCDTALNSELFGQEQKRCSENFQDNQNCQVANDLTCDLDMHKCISTTLKHVGRAYESAYDKTISILNLQMGDPPIPERVVTAVPRLHKRVPQKSALKMSPCPARNGSYEPPCEVFWVRNLQLVKQVRRIEALVCRMKKHGNLVDGPIATQNLREWIAICRAKGFKPSFQKWAFRHNLVHSWFTHGCPTLEWLQALLQALRICADWSSRREQRVRSSQFQHFVDLDLLHFGGSLANATIKPPRCDSPHCFEIKIKFDAKLSRNTGKRKPSLCLENLDMLRLHEPLLVFGTPCNIVRKHSNGCVEVDSLPPLLSSHFQAWQSQISSDPDEVAKAFFEFWAPFWLRDKDDELVDPKSWSEFLTLLEKIPALHTPDISGNQTLAEWRFAIKSTKHETARGVCGLSQPELAAMDDTLLQYIVSSFNAAKNHGLPAWLMLAKVFLVPKTAEARTFDQMRPITVFALVFRIWTKVAARRLLLQWKLTLPKNVVGALPGRSCTNLTLDTGLKIERFLRLGTDAGGFNLDISKCFNRFGRMPIALFLRKNGFDQQSCDMWISSIGRMTRSACILGSVSEPVQATTGLAEGDPLSVCGMILVGYGWHFLVSETGAVTAVFADDWSWMATEVSVHIAAMKVTQQYLLSLKLVSDPAKCWCWGTTKKARLAWAKINEAVVGSPRHFAVSIAERELGVFMHFSKVTHLGCQRDRIDAALAKLQRLSRLNVGIKDKAKLIQSSIWPTAFFGVESVYIGQKHFNALRSAATQVLTIKTRATSTWLCLSVSHAHVEDPFFFAVLKVLRAWKRLMSCDLDNVACLQHVLAQASTDPHKAYGPAASLRCYLDVLGWSVDGDGAIVDHFNQAFHLPFVSRQWLQTRLWSAWDCVVSQTICKRSGMEDWPEVDLQCTRRVPLPTEQRDAAVLLIQRSLGTLFATQRDHWRNEDYPEETVCPLCGGPDDRAHFPMLCDALSQLREEHAVVLEHVKDKFPHMCFLPVIYKHPKVQLLQSILKTWELPPPSNLAEFGRDERSTSVPCFYTDGSCPFPKLPGGSLAAWSVVWDSFDNDCDRSHVASLVKFGSDIPESFVPLQASLVNGPQTVNRAELTAIIQIIRSVDCAIIFSDSEWGILAFTKVRDEPWPEAHADELNADLLLTLCELAATKDLMQFDLRKVKSHLTNTDAADDLHLYHILGNRLADQVAVKASQPSRSPLHAACWEVANWYTEQMQALTDMTPFLAQTYINRLDAFQHGGKSQTNERKGRFRAEHISTWDVPAEPCVAMVQPDSEVLKAFLPGASVLMCILRWSATLRWPLNDDSSGGISTYELAAHFVGVTGCAVPRRSSGKFHSKFLDPMLVAEADLLPLTQWDVVRVLDMAVTFCRKYLRIDIFPKELYTKRLFLSIFGYKKTIAGYSRRPVLPFQQLHSETLKQMVGNDSLATPKPYVMTHSGMRETNELDLVPHEVRVLQAKRLDHRLRKLGHV